MSSSETGDDTSEASGHTTLEALVRAQLSKALGGKRGMFEGALPTLGFTLCWIASHELKLSLVISAALAGVLLVVRVVQRSTIQFVFNAIVGITIAAIFALRSGNAEDAFLPGIIYNAAYAVGLSLSALVRWPLVGFMIGAVTGEPTQWHRDRHMVALAGRLTWLLALPCVLRVLVQYPLYQAHETAWLGFSKIGMGWPLQIAALAAMVWLLSRDHTPIDVKQRTDVA
ncbi:MAG: DUF3159 domain-containing protein [Nocardioidaceae bacterium]